MNTSINPIRNLSVQDMIDRCKANEGFDVEFIDKAQELLIAFSEQVMSDRVKAEPNYQQFFTRYAAAFLLECGYVAGCAGKELTKPKRTTPNHCVAV